MRTVGVRFAGLLVALAGLSSVHAQTDDGATVLDPITVTPEKSFMPIPRGRPLDQSLEHLRKMMEDRSCKDCPNMSAHFDTETVYTKIGKIITFITGLGATPPELSPEERRDLRLLSAHRE